jgi:hypothetical protein
MSSSTQHFQLLGWRQCLLSAVARYNQWNILVQTWRPTLMMNSSTQKLHLLGWCQCLLFVTAKYNQLNIQIPPWRLTLMMNSSTQKRGWWLSSKPEGSAPLMIVVAAPGTVSTRMLRSASWGLPRHADASGCSEGTVQTWWMY